MTSSMTSISSAWQFLNWAGSKDNVHTQTWSVVDGSLPSPAFNDIFLTSGKKHQNEFQLLVNQAKKGYKKIGRISKGKVMKTDESTEKLLSVCMGKRLIKNRYDKFHCLI
jgi:ABC-type glycerol-3-phosphate transport system substrate-binding protein